MLRPLSRFWKKIRSRTDIDPAFDPVFYARHHPDLSHLRTREQLWQHYSRHGKSEGRPRNGREILSSLEARYGALPGDFSPRMYRLLNEDLARGFSQDHQFTRHFLEQGRDEGRPYCLPGVDANNPAELWQAYFRTAEFVAMSQDWLPHQPLGREAALGFFLAEGVGRLAPISFMHAFDPDFYRQAYQRRREESDVALYRDWLDQGVPAGRAPNERAFLQTLLGRRDFPAGFDWLAYRDRLPNRDRRALHCRAQALKHFLEIGFARDLVAPTAGSFDLFSAAADLHMHQHRLSLAARAYDLAEKADPSRIDGPFLYHRSLAHRLSSPALVRKDLLAALEHGDIPWGGIAAAVDMFAHEGRFDRAFATLADAERRWRRIPQFLACLRQTVQACYDRATASALRLHAENKRAEADALVMQALAQIAAASDQLEPLPPPLGPVPDGPVVILANQDLPQCRHYRVEQKLEQFSHIGIETLAFAEEEAENFILALPKARAAIFYRVAASPAIIRALVHAKRLGIPTYYEIDDLLFDGRYFPDDFESYEGQISLDQFRGLLLGVPLYRFAMSLCDTAIASTPSLARHMESVVASGRSVLLRNGLDLHNEGRPVSDPPALRPPTLFYGSGTKAHNRDFNRNLGPALAVLFDNHPDLRLIIAGYLSISPELERHASRITQFGFIADLDEYWALLSSCDINLAVLAPGMMADCKSEIKWLEAAVLGVPSVVSATRTHREVLIDGVDAMLVEKPEGWLAAIEYLIGDSVLRARMGYAARDKALHDYGLARGASVLASQFGEVPASPGSCLPARARIKVLVCNVFFAPQRYGGATRVAQDNVDFFIDNCPDIEVSIVCTDDGREPHGRLYCDSYRGRPVYRLSVKPDRLRDWHPFNALNEVLFDEVLSRVRPDIVHFHCIQRLTASIVDATARRGIPYVITLHDGWWISDSQFFMDRDGLVHMPDADPLNICPVEGVSAPQSIVRRQALGHRLRGAAHVLAVSETFAAIHRRAGIGSVSTLENGVTPLQRRPGRLGNDDRLSIGFIGGRHLHKGSVLVEAAFRRGRYDRLALTVIDDALTPEEYYQIEWGQTPVLLRGPVPQGEIADLYAGLDVLLAPSIWPESFGLVSREASSLGLWVVASDRGAMGECVLPGENGTIVDVSTIEPLARVLAEMNAAPDRWRGKLSGKPPGHLRTAADQGRDLAALFGKLAVRE